MDISNFNISIPYGAIKRMECFYRQEIPKIFQFLMVRLKEKQQNADINTLTYFNSLWCD